MDLRPTFVLNKTFGNVAVPIMGSIFLFMVGVRFLRGIDWLLLSSLTLGGAAVGAAYYQLRRGLSRLHGSTSEESLARLCLAANSMAIFGYGICVMALELSH